MTTLPLKSEFLFRLALSAGAPQMAGTATNGELRIIPVTGGTAEGPRFTGELVPGTAADWLRVFPDGTAHMDVRLTLKSTSGAIVYMHYSGVRHGPAEVLARMNSGQPTDPSEYYFRTAIRFETGSPEFAWMNKVIAVGIGQRPPSGPTYDVYAIA